MTTLLAHIEIKAGQEAIFEEIMADMVEHTLNEELGARAGINRFGIRLYIRKLTRGLQHVTDAAEPVRWRIRVRRP